MNEPLFLGLGRTIITPSVGCNLSGYAPDVISTSLHDDLTATAFYFRQGDTHVMMVSVTVCSILKSTCDHIRALIEAECGVPRECCIIHAIHTHSGPICNAGYGWGKADPEYQRNVFIPRILEAAKTAAASQIPVTMKISTGESLVGINRRELRIDNKIVLGQNPWGPFDPKMTVITFADEDGKPLANIVHYGCHGTASGKNHEISRDWAGVMIDALEEYSGAVTAFFNGPEGDVGPRLANGKTTGAQHVKYAVEHGGMAACDAIRIYRERNGYVTPKLSVSSEELSIPLLPRIPEAVARELYKEFEGQTVNLKGRKRVYYENVLKSYADGYVEEKAVTVEQIVIRLGDLAIIALPFELFSEIGMRIAGASPFAHTLTLSNTNANSGYLVTEDQICRGGYEVDMFQTRGLQPYVPNADFHLITQTIKHLNKMNEGE